MISVLNLFDIEVRQLAHPNWDWLLNIELQNKQKNAIWVFTQICRFFSNEEVKKN